MLAGLPTGSRENLCRIAVRKRKCQSGPGQHPGTCAFLWMWCRCGMSEHLLPVPQCLPLRFPPSGQTWGKGHEGIIVLELAVGIRKLLGLKWSGSLNWVGSRCADTSRGITHVPWEGTHSHRLCECSPRPRALQVLLHSYTSAPKVTLSRGWGGEGVALEPLSLNGPLCPFPPMQNSQAPCAPCSGNGS